MIMFYGELPLDTCHATRFIPSGSTMLWNAHVNYDETRFCAIPPTLPLRPILTFFIFDFHLPLPLGWLLRDHHFSPPFLSHHFSPSLLLSLSLLDYCPFLFLSPFGINHPKKCSSNWKDQCETTKGEPGLEGNIEGGESRSDLSWASSLLKE